MDGKSEEGRRVVVSMGKRLRESNVMEIKGCFLNYICFYFYRDLDLFFF